MTNDELDRLEALLAGDVSPAPWMVAQGDPDKVVHTHGYQGPFDEHDWYSLCDTTESSAQNDAALIVALRNAAPGLIAAARGAAEAEEALGAAKLDAEAAREAVGMATERAERAEAALRALVAALPTCGWQDCGAPATATGGDDFWCDAHAPDGYPELAHAPELRAAGALFDDELPETLPRGAGDTLPAGPLPDATDEAWLLARARGETVDHPDPERAAGYVRLEEALRSLPLPEMPPGLVERVLKAIDEKGGE